MHGVKKHFSLRCLDKVFEAGSIHTLTSDLCGHFTPCIVGSDRQSTVNLILECFLLQFFPERGIDRSVNMRNSNSSQGNAKVDMKEVMGEFNSLMGALEEERGTASDEPSHTPFDDISSMVQRSNERETNEREADQTADGIFSRRSSGAAPPTDKYDFIFSRKATAAPQQPREASPDSSYTPDASTAGQNAHAHRDGMEKEARIEVLERNTASILDALSDECKRSAILQDDVDMTKLEKDAQIDDLRLVIHRLKKQIRALVSERSLEEVYGVMEDEVHRLTRSLEAERQRSTALENRLLDRMVPAQRTRAESEGHPSAVMSSSSSSSDEEGGEGEVEVDLSYLSTDADDRMAGVGEVSFLSSSGMVGAGLTSGSNNLSHQYHNTSLVTETAGLTFKESRRLLKQVKHLNKVVSDLKQANEGLKSTERLHTISVRQTKDAARRVFLANEQAEKLRVDLEKEKSSHGKVMKSLTMVRNEVGALHDENRGLRQQLETCKRDIVHMHKQAMEVEAKRLKEKKMEQFVSKHVPVSVGATSGRKQGGGSLKQKNRQAGEEQTASTRRNSSMSLPHGSSTVFDLNMSVMSLAEEFEDGTSQTPNHSFRKTLRKSQHDSHQLRSIQKHKLDESALNDLLTELRAMAVFKAPDLLPLIRSVIGGLADEREVWRQMVLAVKKAGMT